MISREAIVKALKAYEAARCRFMLEYPGPNGCAYAGLNPEDIADAIVDLINLPARVSGLTPDEYAEWVKLNGRVRCAGFTARKTQCKHTISGPQYTNPFEWKKVRDLQQYCPVHGGA